MRDAFDVASVRAAEAELMRTVAPLDLMRKAAYGLAQACIGLLKVRRARVTGSRVVLLCGAGNNGGDALFAGRALARRGAAVVAIGLSDELHAAGSQALVAAGGSVVGRSTVQSDPDAAHALIRDADLVIDGIVGIGGHGPLRAPADALVRGIDRDRTLTVAVDLPSGIEPDTGEVADPGRVFRADLTVTFGCLKPGLVAEPGRSAAGLVEVVDIGLGPHLHGTPAVRVLQLADVADFVPEPGASDYKYNHGVLGVVAGSRRFPGAAHMVVGAGRHTGVGMVRIANRDEAVSHAVIDRYPDVVAAQESSLADDPRATAWVVGPGAGEDHGTATAIAQVLSTEHPVVIDADAISVVARDESLRALIGQRRALTVLTPHVGEFSRLGFEVQGGRISSACRASEVLGATVVLKGPGTVIADPRGSAFVDPIGPADLATAGTGDALAGIIGGLLARFAATDAPADPEMATRAVAAGVFLHGLAARRASERGMPMTAWDLVQSVPDAVATARRIRSAV